MLDHDRRPPVAASEPVGVTTMLGSLVRVLSALLLAWVAFIIGAVAYAKMMGRSSTIPEPDADEIDLVATFDQAAVHRFDQNGHRL